MKKILLTKDDQENLAEVFRLFSEVESVYHFVMPEKEFDEDPTDLDLVVKGDEVDHLIIGKAVDLIEAESGLPYFINLFNDREILDDELRAHIERTGTKIYQK